MGSAFETFVGEIERLWPLARNLAVGLVQPWQLIQLGLVLACLVCAHFLASMLAPRVDGWMRGLENMPRSRLRALLVLARRLRPILFIGFAWAIVLVLRISTWPSRSYLIALIASLASAWLFVAIASRLIRNRLVRAVVTWGALAFVTVSILGLTEQAANVLDRAAINLGTVNISLLLVLQAAITLGVLIALSKVLVGSGIRRLDRTEDLSASMKVLTAKVLRIVVYGAAVVIGLKVVGFDLTNLALLSGAIGLGIGFGLQKVVSNLVSGVILLLDKSIKPGDVISLGDTFGWIAGLGARYVSVVTRDGREYLIPNEDLITNQVVNWSHSSNLVRIDLDFGVSYAADPHQVRDVARAAATCADRVVAEPAPVCHIVGFGDSSIDFVLRFWISDPNRGVTNVRGDVFLALWDALKAAEIEIPYPRRDVMIRGSPPATVAPSARSGPAAQP